ncbi:DUF6286 domain-containing protein [Promicromonospora sp. Marseille-Q5078]
MTTLENDTGATTADAARDPVPAAPAHRSGASARAAAVVLATLLVAASVVAGQEAAAARSVGGLSPEDGWVRSAAERLDGTVLGSTAIGVGVAACLVGLLLLVAAWRRGVRPARLRDVPAVVLRPEDVARLASAAAADVDGVLGATSTASRRSVVVRVRTTGDEGVAREVTEVVGACLAVLDPAPQVRVRATTSEGAA